MNIEIKLTHKMLVPGYRKGRYVVIERVRAMKNGFMLILYRCLCDCGNETHITKNDLQKAKGCAKCRWSREKTADKYPPGYKKNGYTIVEKVGKKVPGRTAIYYLCRCDCGVEKVIARSTFERSEGCMACRVNRFEGRLGKKKEAQ